LVREIQRDWQLKAEMVPLSARETALGRNLGGEGFVGFTQTLLISGARRVCLSLWKVDDTATALLMPTVLRQAAGPAQRAQDQDSHGRGPARCEAKVWLRGLRRAEVMKLMAETSGGTKRGKGRAPAEAAAIPGRNDDDRPYEALITGPRSCSPVIPID
jgi:CHAT domain